MGWQSILVAAAAGPALAAGGWQVSSKTSALDGHSTAVATLASRTDVSDVAGSPAKAALIVRCAGGVVAYIDWPAVLGLSPVFVRYKIDDRALDGGFWKTSESGTAAGLWNTREAVKWLREFGADPHQLVVGAEPHGRVEEEVEFDVSGMAEAIRPVLAACGL